MPFLWRFFLFQLFEARISWFSWLLPLPFGCAPFPYIAFLVLVQSEALIFTRLADESMPPTKTRTKTEKRSIAYNMCTLCALIFYTFCALWTSCFCPEMGDWCGPPCWSHCLHSLCDIFMRSNIVASNLRCVWVTTPAADIRNSLLSARSPFGHLFLANTFMALRWNILCCCCGTD